MHKTVMLEPSHELVHLAQHYDCDESAVFLEAVNRARENDEPLDTPEMYTIVEELVDALIDNAAIMLTDRNTLLEFQEVSVDEDDGEEDEDSSDDD